MDHKGGKAYGQLKKAQELDLDAINRAYLEDKAYSQVEDLGQMLEQYKKQFMEFDLDNSGDIDLMELKMMMEKLGQAKTHLELKKMIEEVDRTNSGTIKYDDFLYMMLDKRSSILKLILKHEEKMEEGERPHGVSPQRSLDQLP